MIDTSLQSVMPLHARTITSGANAFSIPKSAMRVDDAREAGRIGAPAADAVEISSLRDSDAVALYPSYAPMQPVPPQEDRLWQRNVAGIEGEDGDGGKGDLLRDDVFESEEGTDETEEAGEAKEGDKDARGEKLDADEQREVDKLKDRDREVRQHEQAHKAAGGQYAGAVSYEYQQGPDGRRYAVGGEVSIDISKEKDPSATIAKMQQVRAAALAPAEPSGQDQSVAAQASQLEAEARKELNKERTGEGDKDGAAKTGQKDDGDSDEGTEGVAGAASTKNGETGSAMDILAASSDNSASAPSAKLGFGYRASPYASSGMMSLFSPHPIDIIA